MIFTDDHLDTLCYLTRSKRNLRGYADLDGATFIDCDLRNAQFQGVSLNRADFMQSKLEGAGFAGEA